MSVINTNVKSLVAQNALTVNGRAMSKTMEQLSTGKRINSAADDAAGLAISTKMTAQVRGLNQAVRNANDAISMLQTVEGAMVEQTNMVQRMRELAVQSATDSLSDADRAHLDAEFQALLGEIDRIGANTTWNNMNVLDASAGTDEDGKFTFFVGANNGNATIDVQVGDMSSAEILDDLDALVVTDTAKSKEAILAIDAALEALSTQRAAIGAGINTLTYAADNLANISTNTAASRSRILDTDYAQATTELARTQIIQQAATAMLAQANQQPSSVLSLLQ
jgi:flagellin